MITIEKLREVGCNVNEGLQRCMNNADFYLMLVNKGLKDEDIPNLKAAVNNKDYQKGFEISHALKGVYGNLSLTPLYNSVVVICEHLRNKESINYAPLLEELEELYLKIKSL